MIKKTVFSLILCLSANAFCLDKVNLEKLGKDIVHNDKAQSFAAGALSAYLRPLIVEQFKSQPARAAAVTSMIFLAHGLNIFRKDQDKMKRFISTLFGAATTAFIRNK